MSLKYFTILSLGVLAVSISTQAQVPTSAESYQHQIVVALAAEPDDQGDPAFDTYRQGYNLILDEQWEAARSKLSEVAAKFAASRYAEDAQYWSAYALMHIDPRKAADAYRRFLRRYPRSTYFDDAVADFARLQSETPVDLPRADTLVMHLRMPGTQVVLDLQRLEREIRSIRITPPSPPPPPARISITNIDDSTEFLLKMIPEDPRLDRSVKLKIESLQNAVEKLHEKMASLKLKQCVLDREEPLMAREYAIALLTQAGRIANRTAVQTLREVALDLQQPTVLRERAISALATSDPVNALPVFKEIVKKDHLERTRMLSIEAISQCDDKPRSVGTLIQLFKETPKEQTQQREALLNAIAVSDGDRSLQFLKDVAQTDENKQAQNLAIYWIGEMSEEKDKSVETLSKLFREIPEHRTDELESIMYSVANIGNDRAIDFLVSVASTSKSDELRSNAVFYLTNIGGEKAREALYKVLERK